MIRVSSLLILNFYAIIVSAQASLPVYDNAKEKNASGDWLITAAKEKATVYQSSNGKDIVLYNGLLKRVFRLLPNVSCIDYKNLSSGQQLLRAVKAEARLTIDGVDYNVGGLYGQKENGYLLPEWVDGFRDSSKDFHFVKYTTGTIKPQLAWKPASKNFRVQYLCFDIKHAQNDHV